MASTTPYGNPVNAAMAPGSSTALHCAEQTLTARLETE
eukprot:CAMPEP_0204244216 /NCGR_PEP_ID=MMETSP0361-20130328/96892_1 /ASSEMBLY_ACC=CAM_ASM_000343 /TAXON_ID=268821 /ORGANISM="Scrippsiella Hangoei, Strain SHTV-5" /LENGTH=37 /DNA_ID= /DNA_START= /DNA_END= /DNA_ORIENTATION=